MTAGEPLFGVTRSLGGKAWRLKPADDAAAGAIMRATGCSDALARLMAARGVTAETAASFLEPRLRDHFPDPSSFLGMDGCASLIWDAIEAGTRIALFADYDVDGATSAAQLYRWLKAAGAPPLIYVPDRIEEGYGPNTAAFEQLKGQGAGLVLTLDCGAASVEPLNAARGMGLTVGVVDHHLMSGEVPFAAALVNPNQPGCGSGCGHLAAAGVTFVLLAALNREGRRRGAFKDRAEPNVLEFADLAALGTICDVVSLTGINRAIAAQGLKVMSGWRNPGLAALAEVAGVTGAASAYHAGFLLGPRINAGGRVGRADLGARLLTTDDPAEAHAIARELDALNAERREIEAAVLEGAVASVELQGVAEDAPVLIAAGDHWHPGVIGIAAGRIKERYNRPSIVIGIDPETGIAKGSGRSVAGVDLGSAVAEAREAGLLLAGGGHAMACGLTVAADRIGELRDFLTERLAGAWASAEEARTYALDAVVHPAAVDFDFCDALSAAAPYGAGNPEPRFALPDLRRTYAQRVGTDHVRFTFEARSGARVSGVAFRSADEPLGQALLKGGEAWFHAAGKLKADDSRFGKRAELHLEDLAEAG
ncbi:MAG: single-stranded-DNA-specific exonuclease RecJ [Oceanicaulis sp.]